MSQLAYLITYIVLILNTCEMTKNLAQVVQISQQCLLTTFNSWKKNLRASKFGSPKKSP